MRLCVWSRSWDWKWIRMISMSLWKSTAKSRPPKTLWNCIVFHSKIMEESLSEKEEVTAKKQYFDTIREGQKAGKTIALYIEKNHPNKAVTKRHTNILNDIAVPHLRQILKLR
ncbi:hypothetical protein AVEN_64842-1 [Araneus ventricosus]|uniref:Uncharacterized protein n=1 Tax=Araneus ventricosus TaxID=182803 RepID=A0A4Y2GJW8_ARAVE|nr:hypothetical protein AVEN_64842-1 [Araneus ventricosus]